MQSKLESPPVLVIAGMRFDHPFGIGFFLFNRRWRRFVSVLQKAPGLLLFQQVAERPGWLLLPRTFLALTWWESRDALKAFYNHPEHQRMIQWAEGGKTGFDLWIEEYFLREPGHYRGAPGGLKAVERKRGLVFR